VQVFGVSDVERNIITVTGHVWAPGDLGLSPGMRLSDALRAVGGVRPGVFTEQVLVTRQQPGSTVPVQLRTSFVDTTGRLSTDLPLEEGDSIRVFSRAEFAESRTVGVSGAVHKAGAVSYREGMTLRDAVLLAGGLDESAYLPAAEIARVTGSPSGGTTSRTFRVPLDSTYLFERRPDGKYLGPPGVQVPTARVPEVVLEPYDQVLILRQPDWKLVRRVEITGEVKFPGTYTLTSQGEKLDDVIRRAGGVTGQGYAEGAAFVRKSDSTGRINVSLVRALRDSADRDNLVLLDGDSVHVPRFSPVVRVSGAVSSPASVAYVPGMNLKYYIDAAGGTLPTGNEDRSYVVQPNGTREVYHHRFAMIPDGVPTPEAGAEVVVPVKPEEKTTLGDRLLPFAQALTALATFVYVISR
jgi:protein involved in polysaccharide export with SLBB domain